MTYFDLYPEHYLERYEEQTENVRCCRGHCIEFPPAARVHTPERLEACLVEGRFGLADPEGAPAVLDRLFQRRGDGWVDEVTIEGRVWPRVLIWLSPPDRLNVETTSREAYEQVDAMIKAQLPARRRTKREHDRSEPSYYYQPSRLHRDDKHRPGPGPAEAIEEVRGEAVRRWSERPNERLDGLTPAAAAQDPERLLDLYDLLELAHYRGTERIGLPAGIDPNCVREHLGIGRRW